MLLKEEMLGVYHELINSSEIQNIEAKRATNSIGDSVMQTVCSFANEPNISCGYLLLGVSEPNENHEKHWVSGVDDVDKILNDLQNNCRNQFNTAIHIDAGILDLENKKVIVIKVFELDAASKPCGFISSGKKSKNFTKTGIWRRGINGDYEAKIEDLYDIIASKTGQSFENIVLPEASWSDIDPDVIAFYRKQRAKVQPDAVELDYSDTDLLLSFNLIQEKNGVFKPNIAGLLLFGSSLALRRHLPMARVDYIRSAGTQWVEHSDERFIYTKDFREPLILMIPRIEAMIMDDMPNHFRLNENELQRSDEPLLPQRVVREALVNMVMHRDYSENQPSQINRYKDRLELQNAGYSLKPLDALDSSSSLTRNPLIASVLYDLRLAETKGSGIRTMRAKLKQAGLSEPKFDSDHTRNYFKATFLLHQLMDDKQLKWLEAFDNHDLSDDDAMALMLAHETGAVDNSTLREITKLETLSASRLLSRLCKKDLLQKQGGGSSTTYTLTEHALGLNPSGRIKNNKIKQNNLGASDQTSGASDQTSGASDQTSGASDQTSGASDQTSGASDQTSGASDQTSGANDQTSGASDQTSGASDQTSGANDQYLLDLSDIEKIEDLPQKTLSQLNDLPKKASMKQIQGILLLLCNQQKFSTEELAKSINRNSDYLRTKYINSLLSKGLLSQTYAETPNHPNQTYSTTEAGIEWLSNENNIVPNIKKQDD
ncbi:MULTISPECIES: ATP-binding protein [Psychrobacter]|uniref:ATP-binding protein n=1 Tax=Psychrobacter TaxID=497 RepID=UPI0003F70C19|nr:MULTISPECIES: ATP-binding protein [Psychrobacter]